MRMPRRRATGCPMACPPLAPAGRRRRDRATSVRPGPPPMPCRRPPSERPPLTWGSQPPPGQGAQTPCGTPTRSQGAPNNREGLGPCPGGLARLHPPWAAQGFSACTRGGLAPELRALCLPVPGPLPVPAPAPAPRLGGCLGPRVWGRVRAVPSPPPAGTLPTCLTTPLLGRGLPRIPPHQPPPSPISVFVVLPINGSGAQVSEEPWDQPHPHCPLGACRDMGPRSPKAAGGPCSLPGAGSSPARGDLWRWPWPWLLSHGTGPMAGGPGWGTQVSAARGQLLHGGGGHRAPHLAIPQVQPSQDRAQGEGLMGVPSHSPGAAEAGGRRRVLAAGLLLLGGPQPTAPHPTPSPGQAGGARPAPWLELPPEPTPSVPGVLALCLWNSRTPVHDGSADPIGTGPPILAAAPIPTLGHGLPTLWGEQTWGLPRPWAPQLSGGAIACFQPAVPQACVLMAAGGGGCPGGVRTGYPPGANVEAGAHRPLLQERERGRGWEGGSLSSCCW